MLKWSIWSLQMMPAAAPVENSNNVSKSWFLPVTGHLVWKSGLFMLWLLLLLQPDAQTRSLGGAVSSAAAVGSFSAALQPVTSSPWQARDSSKQGVPQPSGRTEVCPSTQTCVHFPVWAEQNFMGQYFGLIGAGEPFGYQPTRPCCRCPCSCCWSRRCSSCSSCGSGRSRQSRRPPCACECSANLPHCVNGLIFCCCFAAVGTWNRSEVPMKTFGNKYFVISLFFLEKHWLVSSAVMS